MSTVRPIDPAGFTWRMSIAYAGVFAPLAIQIAFLPLWLEHVGFDAAQIGLLLSIPMAVRIVTTPPLVAMSDAVRSRGRLYVVAALAALVASLGYLLPLDFAGMLIVGTLVAVASALSIPLADAIALSGVRRFGFGYGPMRLWGSIAFIAVTLAVGEMIERTGAGVVPYAFLATFAFMVLTGLSLPRGGNGLPGRGGRSVLLRDRALLLGLGSGALIVASHASYYGFSSIHWNALGFDGGTIGLLWGVGVTAEIVLFALARRLFPRATPRALLLAGGIAAVTRWGSFTVDGGVAFYVVNSVLHGATFGAAHLGMQNLIAVRVSDAAQGAAQGIAAAIAGPAMAAATALAGWLYGVAGVDSFWAMAALGALGMALAVFVQPQSTVAGGETREPL